MNSSALRNLVYAQLSFFSFLLLTVLLLTYRGFEDNHGLSYYGEHMDTIIPYGLGLLTCALFIWRGASSLSGPLGSALRALSVLLVLDLATPDTINDAFYWAHVAVSTLLFLLEFAIGLGLVLTVLRAQLIALFAAQFFTGLIAMFSQFHVIHLLSVGILGFQLAFGVLLVVAVRELFGAGEEPTVAVTA